MPAALIFGASRGLGRALAEEHLRSGWHVTATVRNGDALEDLASAALTVETIDTTDWATVDALHDRLGDRQLDLLFVDAASAGSSTIPIGDVTADAFAEMMLVNVLAPLRIVDRYVEPDGTVAVMSSSLGSIALNDSGGWEACRTERDGMVDRAVRATVPPRIDYALTALGLSLSTAVRQLADWVVAHRDDIRKNRRHFETRARREQP